MTLDDEALLAPPGKTGSVEFSLDTTDGFFTLLLSGAGDPGLVKGNRTDGFHLEIDPGDTWDITLSLDPRNQWAFDNPAITFKNPADAPFYAIRSTSPNRVVLRAISTQPAAIPKPWPEQIHPFNLHLKVRQSADAEYRLTIDPDVKNPPR